MRWLSSTRQLEESSFDDLLSILTWVTAFAMVPAFGLYLVQIAGFRRVLLISLAGALGSSLIVGPTIHWKGDVGIYSTALCLAIFAGGHRNWLRATLVTSTLMSIQYDARGQVVFGIMTLGFTFTRTDRARRLAARPLRSAIAIGTLGAAAVLAIYRAMLAGYLGDEAQLRTLQQSAYGNPILGGRVEWAAAGEVFKFSPWGYGTGTITPSSVQSMAVRAIEYAGGDYTSSYFTLQMFGNRHDFHSALINLWFHFGIVGVALAVTIAIIMIKSISKALDHHTTIGPLAIYAIAAAFWDLLFSPMANIDRITFALFICAALHAGVTRFPQNRAIARQQSNDAEPHSATSLNQARARLGAC